MRFVRGRAALAAAALVSSLVLSLPSVAGAAYAPIEDGLDLTIQETACQPRATDFDIPLDAKGGIRTTGTLLGTACSGKVSKYIEGSGWWPAQIDVWNTRKAIPDLSLTVPPAAIASEDGLAIAVVVEWKRAAGGDLRAVDEQVYGVYPGFTANTAFPIFPRSVKGTISGADPNWGQGWRQDFPEYNGADASMTAVNPRLLMSIDGVTFTRCTYFFASVPSTQTVGLWEWREIYAYSDLGRTARKYTEGSATFGHKLNWACQIDFEAEQANTMPITIPNDGYYPTGAGDPLWRNQRMMCEDAVTVVAVSSVDGYDARRLYKALPNWQGFPGDTTVTPNPRTPTDPSTFEAAIGDYWDQVSEVASGTATGLLWPLRILEGLSE